MKRLNSYFTSSNLDSKTLEKIDEKIIRFLKKNTQFLTNGFLKNKNLTDEQIFTIKKNLIEKADLVI
ncbi:MAG: hypothetical protein N2482_03715, partial [Patescibacteria group bacterium]|nr:hypothetical protein [Patescibacteria group bacterium]